MGSRDFLRAMGYCITDEELDAMLDVHGPSRGTSRGGTQLGRTKWSFNMLKLVVTENRGRENSSVEALANALRRLAGGKGNITKEKLVEFTIQEFDITQAKLEEVLASI